MSQLQILLKVFTKIMKELFIEELGDWSLSWMNGTLLSSYAKISKQFIPSLLLHRIKRDLLIKSTQFIQQLFFSFNIY